MLSLREVCTLGQPQVLTRLQCYILLQTVGSRPVACMVLMLIHAGRASGCRLEGCNSREMLWQAHFPIRGATSLGVFTLGRRSEYSKKHKHPACMPDCDTCSHKLQCPFSPSRMLLDVKAPAAVFSVVASSVMFICAQHFILQFAVVM